MKKQTFICQHCNKEFQAYHYKDKPRLYCSKPCHYADRQGENNPQWTSVRMNCDHCNKEFFQKPYLIRPGKGNYCSRRCSAQHTAKQTAAPKKNGYIIECLNCGKEVYKTQKHLRNASELGSFCSNTCIGKYRAKKRVTIICAYCSQKHRVKPSHYNKGAKYCSRECMSKGTEPTSLEIIGYQLLGIMEFDYVCQHRIGKFIVDAYIPSLNLVVQFDGDYWHDQESTKQRDTRHAKYMEERNILFVRVRESELKQDYNVLRERIIHVCKLPPSQVPTIPKLFVPLLNLPVT